MHATHACSIQREEREPLRSRLSWISFSIPQESSNAFDEFGIFRGFIIDLSDISCEITYQGRVRSNDRDILILFLTNSSLIHSE